MIDFSNGSVCKLSRTKVEDIAPSVEPLIFDGEHRNLAIDSVRTSDVGRAALRIGQTGSVGDFC